MEAVDIFNSLHSYRVECGVGGPGQFPHSDAQLRQVKRVASWRARFEAQLPAVHQLLPLTSMLAEKKVSTYTEPPEFLLVGDPEEKLPGVLVN